MIKKNVMLADTFSIFNFQFSIVLLYITKKKTNKLKIMKKKTIIFLPGGMADEAVAELNGLTPLQYAATPAMDSIAHDGRSGTLFTLPEKFPTSSEVANMSVLGCDLPTEYCGRGAVEAAGRNIELGPDDVALRVNLITTVNGVITDFSGGHIDPADALLLIDELNNAFGSEKVRFYPGVSYRNILVLSGPEFTADVKTDKPDDNHGEVVLEHLPLATTPAGEAIVAILQQLIKDAPAVLEASEVNNRLKAEGKSLANGIWPWSAGKAGNMHTLKEKYDISSAVISAVDVIIGLGRLLGMDIMNVLGATGYIDTNYEGKADAAIEAIKTHDLVYVHVEAIDEVSHAQDLKLKLQAIEDFDSRIVARVLAAVGDDVTVAVLPDHPVPISIGKHTRVPVPVAVRMAGVAPDDIDVYSEIACLPGALGSMKADDFMNLLFL